MWLERGQEKRMNKELKKQKITIGETERKALSQFRFPF